MISAIDHSRDTGGAKALHLHSTPDDLGRDWVTERVALALQDLEAFRFQWVARITGMIVAPGVASGRYKGQTALGRAMASPFKSLVVAQGAIG